MQVKEGALWVEKAPRAWSDKIGEYLVNIEFYVSNVDHSLYVRKGDVGFVIIVIYVDDLILTDDSDSGMAEVKGLLKKKFEMKDLGELRYFLGLEVIRCDAAIWLSQRQYSLDMLSKYGMTACKPLSVPLEQNVKLSADIGDEIEDPTMFRRIVGSLI